MTIFIFLDITPCSPLKVNRRFGGSRRLHLQGWRVNQAKKPAWSKQLCQARNRIKQAANMLAVGLMRVSCLATLHVPLKRLLNLYGLRGVTSQKTELFITTAVRTSNSTFLIVLIVYSLSGSTFLFPYFLFSSFLLPSVIILFSFLFFLSFFLFLSFPCIKDPLI
jgi:hypothetical protein